MNRIAPPSALGALLATIFGASIGCFTAPSADVQFSCDPQDAPQCPDGYSCQSDGCCHRDGSDVDANRSRCKLGEADSEAPGTSTTASTTASTTSSATGQPSETTDTDTENGSSSGGEAQTTNPDSSSGTDG